MNNSLVAANGNFRIKILNGPDKGASYQIIKDTISIGRDTSNDIVINDPKCSRNHLVIYFTDDGIQVVNMSKNNKVTINGTEAENALVDPGCIINIGKTKIKVEEAKEIGEVNQKPNDITSPFEGDSGHKKPINKRFLIYGGLGLLVIALLFSETSKKAKEPDLVTEADQEARVESIREKENEIIRARQAKGLNTPEYREAQALYIQGFRDYRERNYGRAIDYFSGALSIFPDHELSQRYLKLSKTKLDEKVQRTLLEANRFYERKMFRKAMASYKTVMLLIGDKTNQIYTEAKARAYECQLLVQGGQ